MLSATLEAVTHAVQTKAGEPDRMIARLSRMRTEIERLGRAIGASADLLPTYEVSEQTGRPHIESEGSEFHYVVTERGTEFERFRARSADDLLYRVFHDVTFSMAMMREVKQRIPGDDCRRQIWQFQMAMLERLNPAWASRCGIEKEAILREHPFNDRAMNV